MIGKTALALAAAALIASAAALLVGAAGFSLYLALESLIGGAGAAASVAGAAAVFLVIVLFLAHERSAPHVAPREAAPHLSSLVGSFAETIKERPILTLGLTALTGLAATRDPNLLKDLWAAVLHKHEPHVH